MNLGLVCYRLGQSSKPHNSLPTYCSGHTNVTDFAHDLPYLRRQVGCEPDDIFILGYKEVKRKP